MKTLLKVFYTAGPGNAFEAFREWKSGRRDLIGSHVAYSRQMFETCASHGARARISCTHPGGEEDSYEGISIVPRADPSRGKSGLRFHFSLYQKARQNIEDAIDFGANVVVIAEDTNPAHYTSLRRRGVHVIQALHTRLWREDRRPSFMQRRRLRDFARVYAAGDMPVLSASDVISAQVEALSGGRGSPIVEFLPLYYPEHYSGLPEPAWQAQVLNIIFIGRIEANKGVFDLIAIAQQLKVAGLAFRIHICGVGAALTDLMREIALHGLSNDITCHGWCNRDDLRRVMSHCHVAVVPTRGDFTEGFNHVVVEAILAGRPAVASSICPAVGYMGDAVKVVQANDVAGYVKVLAEFARDRTTLRRHADACSAAGQRFTETSYSFGAALNNVFSAIKSGTPVVNRRIPTQGGDVLSQ
ncbi:MAG: hypothetical protein ABS40_12325 [Agrobacterium sp. SCN 61-19]|nr:MAG: hypothetical protein ABS40_12325 [Agrobacterium sp. SCN 61-19]